MHPETVEEIEKLRQQVACSSCGWQLADERKHLGLSHAGIYDLRTQAGIDARESRVWRSTGRLPLRLRYAIVCKSCNDGKQRRKMDGLVCETSISSPLCLTEDYKSGAVGAGDLLNDPAGFRAVRFHPSVGVGKLACSSA